MTTINIAEAATADLLAFYNEHAERPIKAFRNRAQAEERVRDLIEANTPDTAENEEELPEAAAPSLLSALVGQVTAEPSPEPEGPAMTSLATLCSELQVVPRIARRRLRKALGNLQEGRWEWDAEDTELLDSIRNIISGSVKAETVTAAQDEE